MGRVTHFLKCWPEPFSEILAGKKTHEIRRTGDRKFSVGDYLRLLEYDPEATTGEPGTGLGAYTGRSTLVEVTYMSHPGTWGLPNNLAVLSIKPVTHEAA